MAERDHRLLERPVEWPVETPTRAAPTGRTAGRDTAIWLIVGSICATLEESPGHGRGPRHRPRTVSGITVSCVKPRRILEVCTFLRVVPVSRRGARAHEVAEADDRVVEPVGDTGMDLSGHLRF